MNSTRPTAVLLAIVLSATTFACPTKTIPGYMGAGGASGGGGAASSAGSAGVGGAAGVAGLAGGGRRGGAGGTGIAGAGGGAGGTGIAGARGGGAGGGAGTVGIAGTGGVGGAAGGVAGTGAVCAATCESYQYCRSSRCVPTYEWTRVMPVTPLDATYSVHGAAVTSSDDVVVQFDLNVGTQPATITFSTPQESTYQMTTVQNSAGTVGIARMTSNNRIVSGDDLPGRSSGRLTGSISKIFHRSPSRRTTTSW